MNRVKTVEGELILVVDEVEETRDAIETLLRANTYRVSAARDERCAVERASRQRPELILMSRSRSADAVAIVRRIRDHANL
jgi:CheY-like chemotaxis protein